MAYAPQYASSLLTREEVDQMQGPVLLEFGANWCGHCQELAPRLQAMMEELPDFPHIKVEDGKGKPLGRSFRVKLWPSLVFMRDGNEVALVASFAAVIGSFLVSYTRAKAEALGLRGDVGFGSRLERVVIVSVGLGLAPWGWLQWPIYLLAAMAWLTVVQRILIRHGVSRDMASLLADDLARAVEYLKTHPTAGSADPRVGYHH